MQHKYMASTDFIQHFMYGSKGGKSIKYLVQVYDFPGETGLNLTKLKNENADRKHPRISLVLCLLLLFFLCGGGGGAGRIPQSHFPDKSTLMFTCFQDL